MVVYNTFNGIETDAALFEILSNFSDDYIDSIIQESLEMKFRPFNNTLPNYPYLLERNFKAVKEHYHGDRTELIDEKRTDTFNRIINSICNYYNLTLINQIPDDNLYSFTFYLNKIFVLEFTERMINFFVNYIVTNAESFVAAIPEEKRTPRTNYAKKIFDNKDKLNYLIIYENMNYVFNILATLDIPFNNLILGLSDENVANFLTSYVADVNDCYKNYFASYLINENTRADMNAAIQLNIMKMVLGSDSILDPNNNPYIVDDGN